MALQESFTRTDGAKLILRQSSDGAWSVKCLTPPAPDADTKQWAVAWEIIGLAGGDGETVPFTEQDARNIYEGYIG